jgi:tetratricopeptide (TPR) repeat protein
MLSWFENLRQGSLSRCVFRAAAWSAVIASCSIGCGGRGGKGAETPASANIGELEQAAAREGMSDEERADALYTLGQAYFAAERFTNAADTFVKWGPLAKSPQPSQSFVAASALAQAKRFSEAVPFAQQAVEGATEPDEAWLKLLVALHFELKQEPEVAAALERLAKGFPTRENLLQLAASYLALNKPDKALTAFETAQAKGLLTEDKDLVNMARLYLQTGAPLKCAAALDKLQAGAGKTPENRELQATCWVMGKDAAHAEPLFKQGGSTFASGDLYLEFGRLELERGQWVEGRDAIVTALQKGGLTSTGDAHLLLGIAHYNTKRKDAALASLGEARKDRSTAKCADEWIKVVKSGRPGATGCGISADNAD